MRCQKVERSPSQPGMPNSKDRTKLESSEPITEPSIAVCDTGSGINKCWGLFDGSEGMSLWIASQAKYNGNPLFRRSGTSAMKLRLP